MTMMKKKTRRTRMAAAVEVRVRKSDAGLGPAQDPDLDPGLVLDLDLEIAQKMKTLTRRIWSCCKRTWASNSRKLERGSRWDPKMKTAEMKEDANAKNFQTLMR